jgi:hypothetical protein
MLKVLPPEQGADDSFAGLALGRKHDHKNAHLHVPVSFDDRQDLLYIVRYNLNYMIFITS